MSSGPFVFLLYRKFEWEGTAVGKEEIKYKVARESRIKIVTGLPD